MVCRMRMGWGLAPGLIAVAISSAAGQPVVWDGDAGTLDWNTDSNWNPNGVPTATSSVTVDAAGVVQSTFAAIVASSVQINTGLSLLNASLTTSAPSEIKGFSSSSGPSTVTANGLLRLTTTPGTHEKVITFRGSVGTRNETDMTLMAGMLVRDAGTLTNTGVIDLSGILTVNQPATFVNNGSLLVRPGSGVRTSDTGSIFSSGVIGMTQAGVCSWEGALDMTGGRIIATDGTIQLRGAWEITGGDMVANFPGRIELLGGLTAHTMNASPLTGSGTIQLGANPISITTDVTSSLTSGDGLFIDGLVNLDAKLTNTGQLTLSGGRLLDPNLMGELVNDGTMSLLHSPRIDVGVRGSGTTVIEGSVNLNSAFRVDAGGTMEFIKTAVINQTAGQLTIAGAMLMGPNFPALEAVSINIPVTFEAGSSLTVQSGLVLAFRTDTTWNGGTVMMGNGMPSQHVTVTFNGGPNDTNEFVGAITFAGSGTLEFGDILGNRPMVVVDDTLTLSLTGNPQFDRAILRTVMSGQGVIANVGNAESRAGLSLRVPLVNTGLLTIASTFSPESALVNQGVVEQNSSISFKNATITNAGIWNAHPSTVSTVPSATGLFTNVGLFHVSTNIGGSFAISTDFDNIGTVLVENSLGTFSNVLSVDANGVLTTGSWFAGVNGVLTISPGFTVLRGATTHVRGGNTSFSQLRDLDSIDQDAWLELTEDLDLRNPFLDNQGDVFVEGGTTTTPGDFTIQGGGSTGVNNNARLSSATRIMVGQPPAGQAITDDVIYGRTSSNREGPTEPPTFEAPVIEVWGRVAPGGAVGVLPLRLIGQLLMQPTGRLEIEMDTTGPVEIVDTIEVQGPVTLAGTLTTGLLGTMPPPANTSWTILTTTGGITGSLDAIATTLLPGDRRFRVIQNPASLVLTTTCGGDLTGSIDPSNPGYGFSDGTLDATDFFYYLDRFAADDPIADLTSSIDPNDPGFGVPDGVLDANDFFFYLQLFVAGCS